ncbi:MAG: hypothetical protein ACPGVH_03630 [Chitinophagales bacterium]
MKSSQDNTMDIPKGKFNFKRLIKKFGIFGFAFFLVKGIGWIVLFVLSYYFGVELFN